MQKMKDSGIEWIGEIPKKIETFRIKYLIDINKGKLPKETNSEMLGYRYIGANEMNGKKSNIYTTDNDIIKCDNTDILVLWDGANAGLVATGLNGAVSSTVVKISSVDSKVHERFLYYIFKNAEPYFKYKVNGTTIPHMNSKYFEEVPFLFYSIEIQTKIADYLDKKCAVIDSLVANERAMIDKLNEYKKSVITEAVTKGIDKSVPLKDSGVEWIGQIPESWNVATIKEIASAKINKTTEKNYPYIALENIESYNCKYIYTDSVYDTCSANLAVAGDIIFGKLRPYLAKVYQIRENSLVNSEFAILTPNNIVSNYLKYCLVNARFVEYINSTTFGTKMPRANIEDIKNATIAIAPLIDQEKIADYLDKKCAVIDKLIELKKAKIDKLGEYKKAMIYEYVTGKKQVV